MTRSTQQQNENITATGSLKRDLLKADGEVTMWSRTGWSSLCRYAFVSYVYIRSRLDADLFQRLWKVPCWKVAASGTLARKRTTP